MWLGFGEAAVANKGFGIASTDPPFIWDATECGCEIREDIHMLAAGGATAIGVVEVINTDIVYPYE